MAQQTEIAWCDSTFNPWIGCTKVSPGCDHCYAEAQDKFRSWTPMGWGAGNPRRRTSEQLWNQPLKWNAQAFYQCVDCGLRGTAQDIGREPKGPCSHGVTKLVRRRVFCASLADVFDNEVDPKWRVDLFTLIRSTPNLDYLLLTKRIGNVPGMVRKVARASADWPHVDTMQVALPSNVWLGATIVNQEEADRDIPKLLGIPARVRFLSMEPLLGPVNLWLPTRTWETGRGPYGTEEPTLMCDHCCNGDRCDDPTHCERGRPEWRVHCRHCRGTGRGKPIDWVIVGGESGPKARTFDLTWAQSLVDQCRSAGVAVLVKQLGDNPCRTDGSVIEVHDYGSKGKHIERWPEALRVRQFPELAHA